MKTLVTIGGECFGAEYIDVGQADGRDGVLYYFKVQDLVKDRGLRNVSLFRPGTERVFIEDYDARIENVRFNVLIAFGRGSKQVEVDDMDIALQLFQRQLIIRKVCFRSEVPDKVGFYLGKIKDITNRMKKQLEAGKAESEVALSRRDYESLTNAYRDNEEHFFEKAWTTHAKVHLREVEIQKANGQKYKKFLPVAND